MIDAGGCAGTVFVWVGDNSRTMPNLSASSSNKYVRTNKHMCTTCTSGVRTAEHIAIMVHHLQSPMPAVSTLMTTTVEQSSVSTERAEAFCQHLGQYFFVPSPFPFPGAVPGLYSRTVSRS